MEMISKELEAKLQNAETLEDVQKVFAEEGIEVTMEQLEAELAKAKNGELDENALDNVAGGTILPVIIGGGVALWWYLRNRRRR